MVGILHYEKSRVAATKREKAAALVPQTEGASSYSDCRWIWMILDVPQKFHPQSIVGKIYPANFALITLESLSQIQPVPAGTVNRISVVARSGHNFSCRATLFFGWEADLQERPTYHRGPKQMVWDNTHQACSASAPILRIVFLYGICYECLKLYVVGIIGGDIIVSSSSCSPLLQSFSKLV